MRIKFKDKTKVESIDEDTIYLENGVKIKFIHQQDCCENVYADLSCLQDTTFKDTEFDEFGLENKEDVGVVIGLGWYSANRYLINCYNEQNGYYSDNLTAIISGGELGYTVEFDCAKKDEIY